MISTGFFLAIYVFFAVKMNSSGISIGTKHTTFRRRYASGALVNPEPNGSRGTAKQGESLATNALGFTLMVVIKIRWQRSGDAG